MLNYFLTRWRRFRAWCRGNVYLDEDEARVVSMFATFHTFDGHTGVLFLAMLSGVPPVRLVKILHRLKRCNIIEIKGKP